MTFDPRGWREIGDDERLALRPYTLDCSALSGAACKQVRSEFNASSAKALKALVSELRRDPTQAECDALRAALVRWFNEERIPLIAPEAVH
jgi:hypothetical protein